MAIVEMINGKKNDSGKIITYKTLGSVKRLINYILNPEKTNELICGGIYCNPNTAYEEFILNKTFHGKLPEPGDLRNRQAIHFVQSFDPKDHVTPELAKKVADELLKHKQFEGCQIVYAVHTDKQSTHTHFVINSVNYETGYMWQMCPRELQTIKDYSDQLCREHGISVIPEREKDKTHMHRSSGEYRAEQKGISWKKETFESAKECKNVATGREEFIKLMSKMGYSVRWTDSRKDITFTNSNGKKINSDKLGYPKKGYTPFTKENLEKQFSLNKQIENKHYPSIYNKQMADKTEILTRGLIKLGRMSGGKSVTPSSNVPRGRLEGNALRDKLKSLEQGQGLDWER